MYETWKVLVAWKVACGGGSRWWRRTQAPPHALCQTGPKGNCQFAPALRHQEDDDGVASSPNPSSSIRRVSSLCSTMCWGWRSSDKQWHASPGVMPLGLGAQPVLAKRRHWKHHFMPGLERYFIGLIHCGGKEERRDIKQGWVGEEGSTHLPGDNNFWILASFIAQSVKNLPVMQEAWVRFPGQEDPLEKEMATHSSTLAWEIPRIEEPGRLQSMRSQESDMT